MREVVRMIKRKSLEVRLAQSEAEIDAAQALRYRVFYEELNAQPDAQARQNRRDVDDLDARCDHLLVLDHAAGAEAPQVVGTYRMNLVTDARRCDAFYSAQEFDLTPLLDYPGGLLEVGRSCVAPDYRRGGVMQLLWAGIAEFVARHNVGLMFGCASFSGSDPELWADGLSYLHHLHLARPELRPRAAEGRFVAMDRLPRDAIDEEKAWAALPPLVKGYLRLGGVVGDGAVVDRQFDTVDVCIVVEANRIAEKYYRFYLSRHRAEAA
jgi:putative hemolysin